MIACSHAHCRVHVKVGVADHAAWLADDSERKRLRAHQFSYADLFSGIFLGAQAESTCGQMFISSLFFAPRYETAAYRAYVTGESVETVMAKQAARGKP